MFSALKKLVGSEPAPGREKNIPAGLQSMNQALQRRFAKGVQYNSECGAGGRGAGPGPGRPRAAAGAVRALQAVPSLPGAAARRFGREGRGLRPPTRGPSREAGARALRSGGAAAEPAALRGARDPGGLAREGRWLRNRQSSGPGALAFPWQAPICRRNISDATRPAPHLFLKEARKGLV